MQARNERSNSTGRRGWANLVPGVRSTARAVVAVSRLAVLGLLLQPVAVWATEYVWDHDGATSGTKDWSTAANWSGDTVPTFAAGDTLDLSTIDLTAVAGVRLVDGETGDITLGTIKIGSAANDEVPWTISRTGTQVFNMDNGASAAQIIWPTKRYNNIQVPMVLYSNLDLNNKVDRTQNLYTGATTVGITSAGGLRTISNKSTGTAAADYGTSILISGVIADGAGQVRAVQNGTTQSSMYLSGNNTFTGGVVIESGRIYATSAGMAANDLTVNSGIFELYVDATVKIGGLAGTSGGTVRTGKTAWNGSTALSSTLEISPASGSYTFPGVLANQGSGVLSVTKTGNGTQILSGTSTYTGATAVSNGTLLVNGTLSGAGGTVTVAGGGTLGGTGTIERAVQFEAGSAMQVNAGDTPNHLKVTGAVTLDSSSALDVVGTFTEPSYTVLTATSVTGTFNPASAPSGYAIAYTPTGAPDTVTLEAVPGGTVFIFR